MPKKVWYILLLQTKLNNPPSAVAGARFACVCQHHRVSDLQDSNSLLNDT